MLIFHRPSSKLLQINSLTGLGILLTLWYMEHPYFGIFHDGRLYTGQALEYLNPKTYANDLFFLYGSQNKYTIFTLGYAKAIDYLGLNYAVLGLTFLGLGLWFSSSIYLIATLVSDWIFWLALSVITLLPGNYGSGYIFEYAENFLTPRLFSEALVLFSIGLAYKDRWWYSGILLLSSFATHPLITLPAIPILFFYRGSYSKSWLMWFTVVLCVSSLLVGLEVEPFGRLLKVMDDEWYDIVMQRSPHLTITSWKTVDWMTVMINLSILMCAWQVAEPPLKKLFSAVLITTCIALFIFLLGDVVFHNVLIIQLQCWRILWLTQWFAYFAIAWLIGNYWRTSEFSRLIILLFFSAWLMREHTGALISVFATVAWSWQVAGNHSPQITKLIRVGAYLIVGQALVWFMLNIDIDYQIINFYFSGVEEWAYRLHRIGEGIVLIPLLWLIRHIVIRGDLQRYSYLIFIGTAIFLGFTLYTWHKPQPGLFPQDSQAYDEFSEFRRLIPEMSVVYWKGDSEAEPLLNTWLLINRASYISKPQSAGVVFNRSTAIEAKRRANNVLPLSIQDSFSVSSLVPAKALTRQEKPNRIGLVAVCQDLKLDFVVLSEPVFDVQYLAQQTVSRTKAHHYLYACQPLRSTS